MNILFIMYDQLRFDYLSCAGHPHLHTPNFDRVAGMGVRFTNAFVQSPICDAEAMPRMFVEQLVSMLRQKHAV